MRESEAFIRSLPLKRRFHDRNERRRYEIALVIAAKLIDDPTIRQNGLDYIDRHMGEGDARPDYRALWLELIARDPKDIARQLLADTDRGALLRDTSPVFYVLSAAERDAALARAREGQNAASLPAS
jgi:hypothetical protein